MGITISGATGIDMGGNPLSNASQVDSVVMNENGSNVVSQGELAYNVDTSSYIPNTLASGAIIERGSNANGNYIKYPDGTMITSGSIVVASSNNSGNVYTFPHAFISTPKVTAHANEISSGGASGSIVTEMANATTSFVYVKALGHAASAIYDITNCEIIVNAIGRWK